MYIEIYVRILALLSLFLHKIALNSKKTLLQFGKSPTQFIFTPGAKMCNLVQFNFLSQTDMCRIISETAIQDLTFPETRVMNVSVRIFNMTETLDTIKFTPEKSKQIALARLDLIHKWLEFRRKTNNKLQADYDFVNLQNASNSHLFQVIGKISRGSLHRWHAMLGGTDDYQKLLPQYKYASVNDYRTCLTDEEIKIFMGLLLHPNRISIGKATALTKYKLREQGQSFIPADITFRRYAMWFKNNNYDQWVLARDGEKALSDKVEPYIKRDASLLDVGDILVADGHKLAL